MLQFVLIHRQFLHKCIRISLRNICYGGLDCGLLAHFVEAVGAAAFGPAMLALREALAVELEALGAAALALVRQGHRLQRQLKLTTGSIAAATDICGDSHRWCLFADCWCGGGRVGRLGAFTFAEQGDR